LDAGYKALVFKESRRGSMKTKIWQTINYPVIQEKRAGRIGKGKGRGLLPTRPPPPILPIEIRRNGGQVISEYKLEEKEE